MLAQFGAVKYKLPTSVTVGKLADKTVADFARFFKLGKFGVGLFAVTVFESRLKVGKFDLESAAVNEKFSSLLA